MLIVAWGPALRVFLPVRLVVARQSEPTGRNELKSYEEIMEILEAFALTNSYRAAGELAGCSHHTVEHWVTMRDQGLVARRHRRRRSGSS